MEESQADNKINEKNNTSINKSLENNVAESSKVTTDNRTFLNYNGGIQDFMGYWWNDMSEMP